DRRLRPQDRQAEAGDPEEAGARLAQQGAVEEVTVETGLKATVEVTTWVTKLVGGDGSGTRTVDEPLSRGDTVGDVLRRYSVRFPELDAALWDPGRKTLGAHIEVLVNDAVLGVAYDLDTPLIGGERITLLGQFMGGGSPAGPPSDLSGGLAPPFVHPR